jgi:hypothetical protein
MSRCSLPSRAPEGPGGADPPRGRRRTRHSPRVVDACVNQIGGEAKFLTREICSRRFLGISRRPG